MSWGMRVSDADGNSLLDDELCGLVLYRNFSATWASYSTTSIYKVSFGGLSIQPTDYSLTLLCDCTIPICFIGWAESASVAGFVDGFYCFVRGTGTLNFSLAIDGLSAFVSGTHGIVLKNSAGKRIFDSRHRMIYAKALISAPVDQPSQTALGVSFPFYHDNCSNVRYVISGMFFHMNVYVDIPTSCATAGWFTYCFGLTMNTGYSMFVHNVSGDQGEVFWQTTGTFQSGTNNSNALAPGQTLLVPVIDMALLPP